MDEIREDAAGKGKKSELLGEVLGRAMRIKLAEDQLGLWI